MPENKLSNMSAGVTWHTSRLTDLGKLFVKFVLFLLSLSLLIGCQTTPPEGMPYFTSTTDLRDYLKTTIDSGIYTFSFAYDGDTPLTYKDIDDMTDTCHTQYRRKGNLYYITVTPYPGDRIVDAWRSGDLTVLTREETLTLEYAQDLLRNWTVKASDAWELELLIHDFLVDHITYYDSKVDYVDPENLPSNWTAVGALLNRQANCQGYTDAFYLLATMAGFQVGRMKVDTTEGRHILNAICLDDQWYIVDATYADFDDGTLPTHYLFNAGKDRIRDYTWSPEMEIHPIAEISGSHFYYIHENTMFQDVTSAAEYVAESWCNGGYLFDIMICNETDTTAFDEILYETLTEYDAYFSYTFWYFTDETDIYITVLFE